MNLKTPIDDYIDQQPEAVHERLLTLRSLVKELVPGATEKLSWGMPTFSLHGILVQFAAHKNHIGFYPGPDAIARFQADISGMKWAKGSVQFQNKDPLPLELVRKMVLFRVEENMARAPKRKK
jgi:uncharacterized protein YdhG (YjbR/CyaY superfamily)